MIEHQGNPKPENVSQLRLSKKKDDLIYFRDNYGNIQSITQKEYETDTRSRASVDERLGVITRGGSSELPALQGNDGWTGEKQSTTNKNSGVSIPSKRGETTSQNKHPTGKSLSDLEKKDSRPTRNLENFGQNYLMPR